VACNFRDIDHISISGYSLMWRFSDSFFFGAFYGETIGPTY